VFAEVSGAVLDEVAENNSAAQWVRVLDPPPVPATSTDPTSGPPSPNGQLDIRLLVLAAAVAFCVSLRTARRRAGRGVVSRD
jgi:hypothetical protein